MIPKMRLSSGSVGLPLARVPGWTGGSGAVCWQKAMNPQKQLAPRRAATRISDWMLACHRELQGIAMNGTLGGLHGIVETSYLFAQSASASAVFTIRDSL